MLIQGRVEFRWTERGGVFWGRRLMVRDVFLGIRRDDAGFQQYLFILRSIRLFIPHFFSFLLFLQPSSLHQHQQHQAPLTPAAAPAAGGLL